jgi:hypothetical protein
LNNVPTYDVPSFLDEEEVDTIGAGALFPSQSHTAVLTSSAENGSSKAVEDKG